MLDAEVPHDEAFRSSPDRDLGERRRLGVYYTPERLSKILSAWAIRAGDETILEPSFGGCGFLSAALEALANKGALEPSRQVFGCDVDPFAFSYLAKMLGRQGVTSNFLQSDFLDHFASNAWPSCFDVVLANPPYIPHHKIGRERVRELSQRSWTVSGMGGRASLWAYFMNHALRFLRPGGRMAWVLPGAFLQADYAAPLKTFISSNFQRSVAIIVHDRIFLSEGTDEETVVLLAEGYGVADSSSGLQLGEVGCLEELEGIIDRWQALQWTGSREYGSAAALSLQGDARSMFHALSKSTICQSFGAFGKVQIGLVTGANDFFVLNRTQMLEAGIQAVDCKLILSKFKASKGLELHTNDLLSFADDGGRAFLVTSKTPDEDNPIGKYLNTFDPARKATNSTFKKREIWSQTCDDRLPDAFFPVMHHSGPRLVLNEAGSSCTNTIHRVFFRQKYTADKLKLLAISFVTSFSQVSAELVGRRYGSGVLKHEPRDAEKILLLVPEAPAWEIDEVFRLVDQLLRSGDNLGAMNAADRFIFERANAAIPQAVGDQFAAVLETMRRLRRPDYSRRDNSDS